MIYFLIRITLTISFIFFNIGFIKCQHTTIAPGNANSKSAFFFTGNSKLIIENTAIQNDDQVLVKFIRRLQAEKKINLNNAKHKTSDKGHIYIKNVHPSDSSVENIEEYYRIIVSPAHINVHVKTLKGLTYAIDDLVNLVSGKGGNACINSMDTINYPAFRYRGVMMDFSEGGLLKEEEIFRQLDFLSKWRINQYYFYSEVSIQLEGFEEVNYDRSYSKDQIKRIAAYAKSKGIEVIPFINLYGHLHTLLYREKYSAMGISNYGHELNPNSISVKKTLRSWIKQISDLFDGKFVHIGFDEAWQTKRLSNITDSAINGKKLFLDHLTFVVNEFEKFRKTVLVWTDMENYYPGILTSFPSQAIPVAWDYSADSSSISRTISPVLKSQKPFFIQSAVDGWSNVYPTLKSYVNMKHCLQAKENSNGIGYITSVWTDAVEVFTRNSWLFMAFGGTCAWQGTAPEKDKFIKLYCEKEYSDISEDMYLSFKSLETAQELYKKSFSHGTDGSIIESWANPFKKFYIQNTIKNLSFLKNVRFECERAQENLIHAIHKSKKDSAFLSTLLTTSYLLHYKASRFIWAKNIVERWNDEVSSKDSSFRFTLYYDLINNTNGLIADMLDDLGELKFFYSLSWSSEYLYFRKESILSKFELDFSMWNNLSLQILERQIFDSPQKKLNLFFEEFQSFVN